MAGHCLQDVAEKLTQSQIFEDYRKAFSEATGLPLAFQAVGRRRPALRGNAFSNAFCEMLVKTAPGCRLCMEMQEKLVHAKGERGSETQECLAGLLDSAVPVKLGGQTLGFLQTGQVATQRLKPEDFRRVVAWLKSWNANVDFGALERAFFDTKMLGKEQYAAIVRLLEVFAQHLSAAAEQIAIRIENSEPPMVVKARQFIEARKQDDISLQDVAKAVNTSTFYFCKVFKKATGVTFTNYLSILRVSEAKTLLVNPHLRVSEIAFQIGFKSLTHFNRVFKQITGKTPTEYREQVPQLR